MLHVAFVCTYCCMLIRVVGSYCAKFQIGQGFDCPQCRELMRLLARTQLYFHTSFGLSLSLLKLTSVPSTSKTSEFESKRLLSDAVYFLEKLNLKGTFHELGVCEPKRNAWKIMHNFSRINLAKQEGGHKWWNWPWRSKLEFGLQIRRTISELKQYKKDWFKALFISRTIVKFNSDEFNSKPPMQLDKSRRFCDV